MQETLNVGFATLRDLILKRPASQHEHLQTLLELTTNDKEQVRVQAIHSAKKLHTRPDFALDIEVGELSYYNKSQNRKRTRKNILKSTALTFVNILNYSLFQMIIYGFLLFVFRLLHCLHWSY